MHFIPNISFMLSGLLNFMAKPTIKSYIFIKKLQF